MRRQRHRVRPAIKARKEAVEREREMEAREQEMLNAATGHEESSGGASLKGRLAGELGKVTDAVPETLGRVTDSVPKKVRGGISRLTETVADAAKAAEAKVAGLVPERNAAEGAQPT